MTDVRVTQRIDRPAAEVFAYLCDMSNNPSWQSGQVSCRWTSEPPIEVGSTYDQHARFAGRDILSSFEVTEYEPGHRIRLVSTAGPMPIDVTRTVEPVGDDACEVTAHVQGTPPGWMRLIAPIADRMVARSVTADYERLRAVLETEALAG